MLRLYPLLSAFAWLFFLSPVHAQPDHPQAKKLFNGKDFQGWYKYASDKKIDKEKLISIDPFDKHIVLKGTSQGYLVTDKKYSDYELCFEWRWPVIRETVNNDQEQRRSGVLFHIAGDGDATWPKSLKADLSLERSGDLHLIAGFKLKVDPQFQDSKNSAHFLRNNDSVERQLGEWNQGIIKCHDKYVTIAVNGIRVIVGRDSEYTRGRIAFQTEAGEVHFRNITIRPLEGKAVDPEKDD